MWAFIGDLGISVIPLVPLILGVREYPGQFPEFVIVWSVLVVAWTVVIVALAVRARSRLNRD
jgi:hypothetical protein